MQAKAAARSGSTTAPAKTGRASSRVASKEGEHCQNAAMVRRRRVDVELAKDVLHVLSTRLR